MKKFLKNAVVMVLAFLMMLSIAGCKTKNKKLTKEDVNDAIENVEKGEIKGKVTFTYHLGNDHKKSDSEAADRYVNAFEKKYGDVEVKRDYTAISDERISAGDIGDVFWFPEEKTYKYAVQDQALLPLDGFVAALGIDINDVYSGILNLGRVEGQLYFVARDYNHMALVYNADALKALGKTNDVKPEWTWEQFQELAPKLCNSDYYALDIHLAYSPIYTAFFEAYAGSKAWCDTTNKKITFINEDGSILKAFDEAIQLAKSGYINITNYGGVNYDRSATDGKEAIFVNAQYPVAATKGSEYDTMQVNWDIINMPLFEKPAFGCGASGVGVYNRTANPEAAAALALFFFTPEGQTAFNSGDGGSVPLLNSLATGFDAWKYPDDDWADKNWDAFVYKAATASTPGQVKCRMPIDVAEIIDNQMGGIISEVMNNSAELSDKFSALETQCNQMWSTLE